MTVSLTNAFEINRRDAGTTAPVRARTLGERLRLPLLIAGPLALLLGGGSLYMAGGGTVSTDDAYVQAARATVSTQIAGQVTEVDVKDNQLVHKGDVLFRLDDRPYRIALAQAEAELAAARLRVEADKATYLQTRANLQAALDTLAYEQAEYARQAKLLPQGVTSRARFDQAAHAVQAARQQAAAARERSANVLAGLGGDETLPADRHPAVRQAQAKVDRARLDLSYTVIRAPEDGIVTKVEQIQPGDSLSASAPAFTLISTRDLWVEANFKETQLTYMRPGQPATVEIDSYPGHPFHARVVSTSPGTGSSFSLLPAENATGNWVKVVQRLPVRLEIEDTDPSRPLRTGLSATAEVDTGHRRTF